MTLQNHTSTASNFGFSATRIADLGAAEYTLVTIAADLSGSLTGFESAIGECIQRVVQACRTSPRCDNLMLRCLTFNQSLNELHGFKPLSQCPPGAYANKLRAGGTTALFDAAENSVDSILQYGKQLYDNDFDVNGIAFVLTDGGDNASTATRDSLARTVRDAVGSESLTGLRTILVGVNIHEANVSRYLTTLKSDAGFSDYIELDKADVHTLSKLADFVSQSIATQSQALHSGNGPAAAFSF